MLRLKQRKYNAAIFYLFHEKEIFGRFFFLQTDREKRNPQEKGPGPRLNGDDETVGQGQQTEPVNESLKTTGMTIF